MDIFSWGWGFPTRTTCAILVNWYCFDIDSEPEVVNGVDNLRVIFSHGSFIALSQIMGTVLLPHPTPVSCPRLDLEWTQSVSHWYDACNDVHYNSLWPSDDIWWHSFGSTLAQIMAWCLMAPNHYLNQCWLLVKGVLYSLAFIHLGAISQDLQLMNLMRNMHSEITLSKLLPGASELKFIQGHSLS